MKINLLAAGAFAAGARRAARRLRPARPAPRRRNPTATRRPPAKPRLQHRWMKRFGHLNLSGDQQQHIQSMIDQYSQAHPEGSPRDRDASRELRRQDHGRSDDRSAEPVPPTDARAARANAATSAHDAAAIARRTAISARAAESAVSARTAESAVSARIAESAVSARTTESAISARTAESAVPQGPPDQQYPQGPPNQQYRKDRPISNTACRPINRRPALRLPRSGP